jgi:hypothetical protein
MGLEAWLRSMLQRLEATIDKGLLFLFTDVVFSLFTLFCVAEDEESNNAAEAFAAVREFLSNQFESRGNISY